MVCAAGPVWRHVFLQDLDLSAHSTYQERQVVETVIGDRHWWIGAHEWDLCDHSLGRMSATLRVLAAELRTLLDFESTHLYGILRSWWVRTRKVHRGAMLIGASGYGVLTDLLVSLLPLYIVWSVQIPWRTKLSVCGLMSLGLIATGFGIMRAASLGIKTTDLTCQSSPHLHTAKISAYSVLRGLLYRCHLVQPGIIHCHHHR